MVTKLPNKVYLEISDVDSLEAEASNLRDRLLVRILFRLGCRVSEALGLTADDIDFEVGTVTIQHLKARTHLACPECNARLGRAHTFCPGCGAEVKEAVTLAREHRRKRTLPIDRGTLELLQKYVDRGGPVEKDGKQLIFGICRNTAWRIVTGLARKANLPNLVNPETGRVHNVSPHRLRDAFAVHAVKNNDSGDGLRLLQEHLGHASFNTTARYRKVAGEELKDWYNCLWPEGVKDDSRTETE
ncbi:MAG: tyrosine-type recombinase/integrase [Dehalococcoidia bacterium]